MKRDAAVAPEYSLEGAPAAAAQGTREPLPVDGMTLTPLVRSRDPNTPLSHRDRQVLDAAFRALRMELDVPDGSVRADVRDGQVVLRGTVDWPYQSEAAVRCVERLHGVSSVASLIGVRAAWKRLDNNGGIHDALRLLSEFDQRQELADSAARNASFRRGGHTPQ